jgi:TatD DNase family protein
VPFRGGRNEPARVVNVAETVAALRGMPVAELAAATQLNFDRLFRP